MAISIDATTLGNWKTQVKELKRGCHWCVACGIVSIEPEDNYKVRCHNCFRALKETKNKEGQAKYCRHCGNDLEQSRIDFALRNGGECLQCYWCSKHLKEPIAPDIYVPDHWMPHATTLLQ